VTGIPTSALGLLADHRNAMRAVAAQSPALRTLGPATAGSPRPSTAARINNWKRQQLSDQARRAINPARTDFRPTPQRRNVWGDSKIAGAARPCAPQPPELVVERGAGDGNRTHDIQLGKLACLQTNQQSSCKTAFIARQHRQKLIDILQNGRGECDGPLRANRAPAPANALHPLEPWRSADLECTWRQLMAAGPGGGSRNICSNASQAGTGTAAHCRYAHIECGMQSRKEAPHTVSSSAGVKESESWRTFHNREWIKSHLFNYPRLLAISPSPSSPTNRPPRRPLTPARRHKVRRRLSPISNQQREHRGVAYRGAGQPIERHQKAHGGLCKIHKRPTSSL
jgi:hypothetical protein